MQGKIFLTLIVLVSVVDLLVPYVFLRDIPLFYASFLFWTLLTLAIILFAVFYTRSWR